MREDSFKGVGGLKIFFRSWHPAGSQFFHDTAGSSNKTLKLYPDFVHDLLGDIGKEKVIADIMGWMSARLPVR